MMNNYNYEIGIIKNPRSYEIDLDKIESETDCINILRILINGLNIRVSENYKHFDLIREYLIID